MNEQYILNTFMNMRRGGGQPQEIARQIINNDPAIKQMMIQMENMANGMSPREFAFKYARQNGLKDEQVLQMASMFGIN